MEHIAEWKVALYLFEHDDTSSARAVLDTGSNEIVGTGRADLAGGELDQPEVRDEVAVSRALADLAHQLSDIAEEDRAALYRNSPAVMARRTHPAGVE